MNPIDMFTVRNTCEQFGIAIPAPVLEAEALVAAAEAALEEARALTAPDLATATPKTIGALIGAAADHDGQGSRIAAAQAAVDQMESRRRDAWAQARYGLIEALGRPFDSAAGEFLAAADELRPATDEQGTYKERPYVVDHKRVLDLGLAAPFVAWSAAAGRMSELARARDALDSGQPRNDLGLGQNGPGASYAKVSRFAVVTTKAAVLKVAAAGSDLYEPRWWLNLARIPGVTLRWQLDHERTPFMGLPEGA